MRVQELRNILESGNFAIISAEPNEFGKLLEDMVYLVQRCDHLNKVIVVDGYYGGLKEKSVLVPGLTDWTAENFGHIFKQECVLHGWRGFIYTDDSGRDDVGRIKSQDVVEVYSSMADVPAQAYDNASIAELEDGVIRFSLGLDF